MAYPKGDKLETVIQKAVELGATEIIPFESSRCIKRPKAEKAEKQTQRLQRIAEEAAKQCGRARVPSVSQPLSYGEMLKRAGECSLSLFCYENEDGRSIRDAITACDFPDSISVIVGSEGGFSEEESKLATEAGCLSVTLGKRILRCETAPLYALSAISFHYELG
jgi:16S rRNA (uracil1498-N3)-methyltransferase